MKKNLSCLLILLFYAINTYALVHLDIARKEFEQTNDVARFEEQKYHLCDYYMNAYEEEVACICQNAHGYFAGMSVDESTLIIFDIDDTAIYNYHNHEPAEFIWSKQSDLLNAKITKLPPAINAVFDLYLNLVNKGFKVIFLSGRPHSHYEITLNQLLAAGYTIFDDVILMPESDYAKGDIAGWKARVRADLAQAYSIIGCIADREVDFIGGNTGYSVKLPNYLY